VTSVHDVVGLQRGVVELVTDDAARAAWTADPEGFAAARLSGPAAKVLAGIDPSGLEAMTLSHVAKKDRFDYLHRLHHELEDRKRAEAAAGEGTGSTVPTDHDHGHGHDHDHDGNGHHEHPHTHGELR